MKYNSKIIYFISIVFIFTIVVLLNINLSSSLLNNSDVPLDRITIMTKALAENDAVVSCPGGSCDYTDAFGATCNACCPKGKSPSCSSSGCGCN
jgi:hypothetical protein